MEPLPPWLMFVALFGAILVGLPVAYSLIAISLLFGLPLFGSHLGQQFYGRLYEAASNYTLAAVPLFIFMGVMLERSGIAERLFNAMQLWLGRLPGGLPSPSSRCARSSPPPQASSARSRSSSA